MRIGVTRYVGLTAGSAAPIYAALVETVGRYPGARGVTCLAAGADQLFARAMLAQGGEYDVVLPAGDYRTSAVTPDNRAELDDLLGRAAPNASPTKAAIMDDPRAYGTVNHPTSPARASIDEEAVIPTCGGR